MNKKTTQFLTYTALLLLGIALFWRCLHNLDFKEFWTDIRSARYFWMLLNLICLAISLYFRALRWNILLGTMGYKTKGKTTYGAILIAYLANIIVPRLGDVVRCSVLSKKSNIPFNKSLGTVISEFVIDLAMLFIMGVAVMLFQWDIFDTYIINGSGGNWKNKILVITALALIVVVAIIAVIIIIKKNKKIAELWDGFVTGVKSVLTMNKKGLFIFYTVMIWLFYIIMTWLPFYMMNETSHLGITEATTLVVFVSLGAILPVPGNIGIYHSISDYLLNHFYLVNTSAAKAFVIINHASQMLFYILTGGVTYLFMFVFQREKTHYEQSEGNREQDS